MAAKTEIQWCDSTVNASTGCDGCELWIKGKDGLPTVSACYSGPIHEGRLARSFPHLYAPSFTSVRLAPGRMVKAAALSDLTGKPRPDKPWLDGLPRIIFVGDMGDFFSRDVPFEYIKAELIDVANSPKGRRHVWMTLTKQARRLAAFAAWLGQDEGEPWPPNVWPGVSVTSARTLKRIDGLCRVPAACRFVSAEPMLEEFHLGDHLCSGAGHTDREIDLVVVGGESRQKDHEPRPFHVDWGISLMGECADAGASFFWKQMGSHVIDRHGERIKLKDSHGGDWSEWPADLRVREFPQPLATEAEPC